MASVRDARQMHSSTEEYPCTGNWRLIREDCRSGDLNLGDCEWLGTWGEIEMFAGNRRRETEKPGQSMSSRACNSFAIASVK